MAATDNGQSSNPHLSLANNLNAGSTFAAKARAAELNAARARRDSRDLEEHEVPASVPVPLGALTKFTKPRNKGKWKPVNLSEDQEGDLRHHPESQEDAEDSGSSSEPDTRGVNKVEDLHRGLAILRAITNIKNPHPLRQQLTTNEFNSSAQLMQVSPVVQHLHNNAGLDFDVDQWDPDLPSASPAKGDPASQGPHPLQEELTADELISSAHDVELSSDVQLTRHTQDSSDTTEPNPKSVPQNLANGLLSSLDVNEATLRLGYTAPERVLEGRGPNTGVLFPPGQEARLASLGVLPPVSRESRNYTPPAAGPNADASYSYHHGGTGMHMSDGQSLGGPYQFDANHSRQLYGPMNFGFRFPPQQEMPQYSQHQSMTPYSQQGYFPATQYPDMTPYPQEADAHQTIQGIAPAANFEGNTGSAQSYDGDPMTSKRDILLKSLHDVVESSRTRESSTTVL